MTPPFQPGDRVTVRYNKPLGVLTVRRIERAFGKAWFCVCTGPGVTVTVTDNTLLKVEDDG